MVHFFGHSHQKPPPPPQRPPQHTHRPAQDAASVTAVYFSNWSVYQRKHFPKDINFTFVTHVFYAFLKIDAATGQVALSDPWADTDMPLDGANGAIGQLQQLRRQHNFKICFSVGGWGTAAAFEAVAGDGAKLEAFVESSVALVEKFGFDGLDVDWEYPSTPVQGQQLVHMLAKLRQRLGPRLVTVASPAAADVLANLDLRAMDQYLSFWNVMCYDFCGQAWSQRSGLHSNLFGANGDNGLNCHDIMSFYVDHGIAPHKLVMGMPLYGRQFGRTAGVGAPQSGGCDDTIDYKRLPLPNTAEDFDSRKVSAYCYDAATQTFVAYDNCQSARIKAQYVASHGFRGGMFWDSAGDNPDHSVVAAFGQQLQHGET